MNNQTSNNGGIGIVGMLGIVFVVLKLTGVIDWSWWWVAAPFWGGFVLFVFLFIVIFMYYWIEDQRYKPKRKRS